MKTRSSYVFLITFLALSLMGLLPLATQATPIIHFMRVGGGGSPTTVVTRTFTTPAVYQVESETYTGSSLDTSATWENPSYLSVGVGGSSTTLQILPDTEYESNNGSFTVSTEDTAMNVTFEMPSGSSPYGEFLLAYGVNVEPYMWPNKLFPSTDGIMVVVEHASASDERLIAYMNGVCVLNESAGSLSTSTEYTMGFYYNPSTYQLIIYWYNGGWQSWTTADAVVSGTSVKDEPLSSNGDYFVIGASNAGPGYGYSQWTVVSYSVYQNVEVSPPMKMVISYWATPLANGLNAMSIYDGAYNPINVSVNSTSWALTSVGSLENYSVSGSSYPTSGQVKCLATSSQILLYVDGIYPAPDTDSWYTNMTFTVQLVDSSSSHSFTFTVPMYFIGFAQEDQIGYAYGTYLSGQEVCFTQAVTTMYPPNDGYTLQAGIQAEIDISGVTSGYVSLPYSFSPSVSVTTTYDYIIFTQEDGLAVSSFSDSFTVDPVQNYPVIFGVAPSSVPYGQSFSVCFQFSDNGPIGNITSFQDSAGLLHFSYWKIQESQVTMILSIPETTQGALVFIPSSGQNIYFDFNGSSGVPFSTGENPINIDNVSGIIEVTIGGITTDLPYANIIGVGVYGASMNWLYVDGAIVQNSYAGQSYVVSIGQSLSSLQQITSGYTNATGWAKVTLPTQYPGYELVNIYWYGVKSEVLNVTVSAPVVSQTTSTTTTPLSYNYTTPYSSPQNTSITSSLYNFSSDQPWAMLIGLVVIGVATLLGWKFGNTPGASGGGIAGIVVTGYLGLVPWYLYFVVILIIAMVLGKLIVDRFLGGDGDV